MLTPVKNIFADNRGFVLVTSLMILLILLIIGIAATNTSNTEIQIAANEKFHQESFYQADGGAELASRLTFENALCTNSFGFSENPANSGERHIGKIRVVDRSFATPSGAVASPPTDTSRDAVYYPETFNDDNNIHTNMNIAGSTGSSHGSNVAMGGGYNGNNMTGAQVTYTIWAQHEGLAGSVSLVGLEWKLSADLINNASSSDCRY